MKHTTLYRKWRPRRFGEIAGQGSVVRTLRRAIETDRVAHAYLFSGPRGTGKTSSAKVLSMGLNCVNGPTPEPCGECDSCRAIVNNSSMDVVEMDAASNRGIDEIRELRDRVNLAPVGGRAKVYIIDEVHMLTTEAFNALLKMLEEPPEHVVFVLATTEKHKVLPTIISRCQSFDFRRPSIETLSEKLGEIAEAEGIETEPEALTVIARAGGGSFRDAEGLLDQLSSFSEGKVTAALVRELLGNVGPEALLGTVDALAERRAADALRDLDRLSNEGRDLGQFASELISHLRNLMLLPHAPEVALAEVGADEKASLEEQSGRVPTAEAVRMIEAFGEAVGRIKRGGDAKLELELCFMKLARDYAEPSVESLMSRLESLEMAAGNGGFASSRPPSQPVRTLGAEASVEHRSGGGSGSIEDASGEPEAAGEAASSEPKQAEPEKRDEGGADSPKPAEEGAPPRRFEAEAGEEDAASDPRLGQIEPERGGEEAVPGLEPDMRGPEIREDAPRTREASGPEVSASSGGGLDLASQWANVMQELKRRRQALTAAVYGEARLEGFDGEVLRLVFPGEESFHVKMAQERKHLDHLTEVLEAKFGIKPRLEVASGSGSSGKPSPHPAEAVREESPREEYPGPRKRRCRNRRRRSGARRKPLMTRRASPAAKFETLRRLRPNRLRRWRGVETTMI
jgi:DNA polymerase-3 subunit gamma/tau